MPAWHSDALIVDAVRSPIGKRNGTLSSIRGDELAGQVLNSLVERQDVDPAQVEDVQFGCVTQIGEQGWNIGRMAPLVAGWPETVCGTTVDRQCGSSMQANFNAATAIAEKIASNSPTAVQAVKSAVRMGDGQPTEQAIGIMMSAHWRSAVHPDRIEGIGAFNEGRDPTFQDSDY